MKKIDRIRFENLASGDDATMLAAAKEMQAQERRYYDDQTCQKYQFSPDHLQNLLDAWRHSPHELVRTWVAQVLAFTQTDTDEALAVLAEALSLDCQYINWIAELLRGHIRRIPNGAQLFKSNYRHPNYHVRWRCAMILGSLICEGKFERETDMPILHALILDYNGTTRNEAVLALQSLKDLGAADYEVLLDLVNMYDGSARHYAKELMAKLEAAVPGCAPSNFAPRVPLLRTDGIYACIRAELDTAGVWVSGACLHFFDDGTAGFFGTNEAPVDFPLLLPAHSRYDGKGAVTREGNRIAFSLELPAGWVDCTGRIDGDKIKLTTKWRSSGRIVEEEYSWTHIDWSRTAAVPEPEPEAAPALASSRKKEKPLPFIPARKRSMRAGDAKKWYLLMQARLPLMLEGETDERKRVEKAWQIKTQLRETAADAMYDPALKKEFFAKLPIPAWEEIAPLPPDEAMQRLMTATLSEKRAFPLTVGEAIGLEYHDGRQVWVMTEEGWKARA